MVRFPGAASAISFFLEELPAAQRPRFIAVDGLTCAGKTSLGEYLAPALGAVLLHTDDISQAGPLLWDHERFERDVHQPLSTRHAARLELQHWTADTPHGELTLPETTRIVVVEGIHSLDAAVAVPWDVRVWVKVDEELRLRRAKERDGGARWDCWSSEWLPRELEYVRVQRPEDRADFIVDGDSLPAEARRV
jgi:uridine kinase